MSTLALLRTAGITGWKRWTALLLLVLIPAGAILGFAGAAFAAEPEDGTLKKLSFYGLASATTAYFSEVGSPDNQKALGEGWAEVTGAGTGTVHAANGGSMLGWVDADFNPLDSSWWTSSLSGTSDSMSYSSLDKAGSDFAGMLDYAYFGATLNGLGLDSMGTGLSLGFFEWITGGIIYVLYMLASAVDWLFSAFLSMLAMLNPFKLLYSGISSIPGFPADVASGMVGGDTTVWAPLIGLASFIGDIYEVINSAAWGLMVPIFIAVFLFSLLMFKKMNRGGAMKKLFIRIFFIGIGVPLLGMMYTGTIESMAESAKAGNVGATQVVLSTYVDFESWAQNERLAVPEGATIEWRAFHNRPSSAATMNVRDTALAINVASVDAFDGITPLIGGTGSIGWADSALSATSGSTDSAYDAVTGMLTRFMGGAKVQSADFESDAKSEITSFTANDEGKEKTATEWFTSIREASDVGAVNPSDNPVLTVSDGAGLTRTITGGADGIDNAATLRTYSSPGIVNNCGAQVSSTDGKPLACNLAPLAMYNYLNTSFGSESMVTYSSEKVMSGATKESHNSVTQVGTGAMSFLYWFNSVVLLGAFALIGLGYGLSLVFGNIRRGIQTITAIPFATLGAMAAISKVIVYTVAMILEVVVTIFLYKLVQEFLSSVPSIIEYPFSLVLNGVDVDADAGFISFLVSGGAISLLVTLFSIIGIIIFTVLAMRMRKSIIKAIEEVVTKIVEKLTETQIGMAGGGKMAPAIAGGIGAGAGAAAASRMMGNSSTKGPKGGALPGSPGGNADGNAPDVISTGGTNGTDGSDGSSQPWGAGGTSSVDGEIETGDGTLAIEGGPDSTDGGNGDPGSQAAIGAGTDGAGAENAAGRQVEANGLTQVDSTNAGGVAAGEGDSDQAGVAGGTSSPKAPQADAGDAMADSLDKSAEGYKAADKQRLGAGKDGAEAVGHGAIAVGRGFAGDAAGAAESGGRAVEKGGSAAAAGERAKQTEQDAGRSSLDKPSQKHAQRAQKAEQVSQLGGTVANAAGAASSTGGASKGAAAAKGASATASAPKGGGSAPRPQQAPQRAQQGTTQPQRAPQVQRPQAPRQQPVQPRPQVARPAPQPSVQPAPRPNVVQSTSVVNNVTDRRSKVVNKAAKKKPITPSKGKPKGIKGA